MKKIKIKEWYINVLLDVLHNPSKFKLYRISTWEHNLFHLKPFDTAVTLKYDWGHWKWNEQVKLNEQYRHAKFDIDHIYGIWENPNVRVFDKPRHFSNQKHINYLTWTHSRVAHIILCVDVSMYVTNKQHSNYNEQQSEKKVYLKFMFLTQL